jgi:choline dehydrogenase-like flavoprotein
VEEVLVTFYNISGTYRVARTTVHSGCFGRANISGRSSAGAFEKWAHEVGDQSYTFNNLLPFFKRSVHFNPPDPSSTPRNVTLPYNASSFSNDGGPLEVSFPSHFNAISSWLGNAFTEMGFGRLPGFFDGRLFGWSYFAYSLDPNSQTRSSSETSFLRDALSHTTNLNFYKSTLAKRIILENCKVATGVLVNTAGVEYKLSARREVILSAGAVRRSMHLTPHVRYTEGVY